MAVYVLDRSGKSLDPCSEKRARLLLDRGRARVHRLRPFTIRVVDRKLTDSVVHDFTIRIDPGSRFTGIAVVRETPNAEDANGDPSVAVVNLIEVQHRGSQIRDAMISRSAHRRFRRSRLRFRPARFDNRTRPEGWLPPSLRHRIDTTLSQVEQMRRLLPVTALRMELVKFDTQLMKNAEITGVQYQQGELAGYEVREYLLEKFDRTCAYCDAKGLPLQIEHILAKARGGSNRISNLTIACDPCNTRKAAQDVREFLAHDPKRLAKLLGKLKAPLRDAAMMNATRWTLKAALEKTSLPVSTFSGGRTKWNRSRLGVPKIHALDAAVVGPTASLSGWQVPTLNLKTTGRGSYCRTRLDRYGFPRGYLMRSKSAFGFATGDHVRADVPTGLKTGRHVGRVAIRKTGSFNITTRDGVVQGVNHKHCRILQRGSGYGISQSPKATKEERRIHPQAEA
jgi:5-methylcytosine-specific restriction endonuclease McrA